MNRDEFDSLWNEAMRSSNPTVADFERVADGAVALHASDGQFQHHVRNRLRNIGRQTGKNLSDVEFDLATAQLLIADEIGFASWDELADTLRNGTGRSKPLLFRYAIAAMVRGDFSALESTIGAKDFDDRVRDWCERGFFDDEPETLAEVFTASCMLGYDRAAAYLLDRGVDPYAGMRTGLAGFHYAASSGRLGVIKLLIDRGVPTEVENMYGGTVLGQALWSAVNEHTPQHAAIIEALINAGAAIEPGSLRWWNEQDVPSDETRTRVADALRRAENDSE